MKRWDIWDLLQYVVFIGREGDCNQYVLATDNYDKARAVAEGHMRRGWWVEIEVYGPSHSLFSLEQYKPYPPGKGGKYD
jgi:hypothetical protein